MNVLLTDSLICPRCGTGFPLILLANRVEERRVLEGSLGCSNCRERYPVRQGFGDLRPAPRTPAPASGDLTDPSDEELTMVGALLAPAEGSRPLLIGAAARFAPGLARMVPAAEWIAASPQAAAWPDRERLDRLHVGPELPFADFSVRGVVVEGDVGADVVDEGVRVLAPGHRLVILEAASGVRDALLARGLRVGTPAEGVVVAARGGAG